MTELENARRIIDEADKKIAELFEKRMSAVKTVAEYKSANGLPIFDLEREKAVIEKNVNRLQNDELKDYYTSLISSFMDVSKKYQESLMGKDSCNGCVLPVKNGYNIVIKRGAINEIAALTKINGKVLVVTDNGVPSEYSQKIASQFKDSFVYTVEQGEKSKSIEEFKNILSFMLQKGFTRKDSVIACGGGVVGDLSGFVSACYMRGISFYNFPTTVLSQVDSSVGGKTAVNFENIKNPVGAFYQPKMVIIDPDVLKTLPQRQISNGLVEAVKMSLTCDAELFNIFENCDILSNIDNIIIRSIKIKRSVVEQDEKEQGLRMILNFGHTLGHGIESEEELNGLYHGECVALGMLPMCSENVRARLIKVLDKLNIKTNVNFDFEKVMQAVMHDKKSSDGVINAVYVENIGSCEIKKMTIDELENKLLILKEGQR